jgi:hypothetical protein
VRNISYVLQTATIENFQIAERLKNLEYSDSLVQPYFLCTTRQQEGDSLEELSGKTPAFVFKWNPEMRAKIPKTFKETSGAKGEVVSRDNF